MPNFEKTFYSTQVATTRIKPCHAAALQYLANFGDKHICGGAHMGGKVLSNIKPNAKAQTIGMVLGIMMRTLVGCGWAKEVQNNGRGHKSWKITPMGLHMLSEWKVEPKLRAATIDLKY